MEIITQLQKDFKAKIMEMERAQAKLKKEL